MDYREIKVIMHPGYLETTSEVFDINPGKYVFVVENKSHKNAGFVVTRENEKPIVLTIKKGESRSVEIELKSGNYTYYSPIIPTPPYSIKVQ